MPRTEEELREAIAAEHLRIQASLVRCDDCGHYFRDIKGHVDNSVTVKAIDHEDTL
jgi:uncharacterized Zn finger protein